MGTFGAVAGAGLLSAPATLPGHTPAVDDDWDELVDLLCDDAAWVQDVFDEIVERNWARTPPSRRRWTAGRPGRRREHRRGGPDQDVLRRPQHVPRPHSRQRSPPRRQG